MPETISVEEAERDLRHVLESLSEGERVTAVDETGAPLGNVTGVSREGCDRHQHADARAVDRGELTVRIGRGRAAIGGPPPQFCFAVDDCFVEW